VLDTSDHPNAEIAIKYRKDIQQVLEELTQYLPEYEVLILNTLEKNPQIAPEQLKQLCHDAHAADYYIYDQPELNEALVEVLILGKEAVESFKKSIEILGETADIELIKADLGERYSPENRASANSGITSTPSQPQQSELSQINPSTDRGCKSDSSNLEIGGVSREHSNSESASVKSSKPAKPTKSQNNKRSIDTICRIHGIPSTNLYQLFKKLSITRTFKGNDRYEYSTYDLTTDDMHEAIEYAEKRKGERASKDIFLSDDTGAALQGRRSNSGDKESGESLDSYTPKTSRNWLLDIGFGIGAVLLGRLFGFIGIGAGVVGWVAYSVTEKKHGKIVGVITGIMVALASYSLAAITFLSAI